MGDSWGDLSFFFYSWVEIFGRDVPGGFVLGGTSGEVDKDTRMTFFVMFSPSSSRFFFLFSLLPLFLGMDDLAHVLHAYAAHGIDETNMELMLRKPF